MTDNQYKMIYAFHHNPLDPSIGAGVRMSKVLSLLGERCGLPVTLYAMGNRSYEMRVEGISEKVIRKPFLFRNLKSSFLCMFPFTLSSHLRKQLFPLTATPALLIFETPFFGYPLLKTQKLPKDSLKIYDAHNFEADYWKPYFHTIGTKWIWKRIKTMEKTVAEYVDYVFVTSLQDARAFEREYQIPSAKIIIVPNGVETNEVRPMRDPERISRRTEFNASYSKFVVFMGSNIKANIDAANWIADSLAPRLEAVCFLIIGSVCKSMTNVPRNVRVLGVLPNDKKNRCLGIADAALNPVIIGSGTNVKMLEYLSAGLPTVSTTVGARGLEIENGVNAIVCNLDEFEDRLLEILNNDDLRSALGAAARKKAEDFDWNKILDRVIENIFA
ncbi:MAG: glycosyltransferase family 4 protein [Nitrososphaerales archaeon]